MQLQCYIPFRFLQAHYLFDGYLLCLFIGELPTPTDAFVCVCTRSVVLVFQISRGFQVLLVAPCLPSCGHNVAA